MQPLESKQEEPSRVADTDKKSTGNHSLRILAKCRLKCRQSLMGDSVQQAQSRQPVPLKSKREEPCLVAETDKKPTGNPSLDSSELSPEMWQSLMRDSVRQKTSGSPNSLPTKSNHTSTADELLTLPDKSPPIPFSTLLQQSPKPRGWNVQSAHYTLSVKLYSLRRAVLTDPYINRELACFIAPNGQSESDTTASPLYPWVKQELLQGDAQVLLLQAPSGAGKSLFNHYLERTLWQDPAWQAYRPGDPVPNVLLPLFIPLQSTQVRPQNLWDYCRHLSIPDGGSFTREEIAILQSSFRCLLIADGYDEIAGFGCRSR